MKLRLKGNEGNSLRLRVSRSELERLLRGEALVEELRFGADVLCTFLYTLQITGDATAVAVVCKPGLVAVKVSKARGAQWALESEVGIYETLSIEQTLEGDAARLDVVIEKDFACLDRPLEENADTFANPNEAC